MDTSETYIKQCERATEIQNQKPIIDATCFDQWSPGNWIAYMGMKDYCYFVTDTETFTGQEERIWLPRQDQLQEMISNRGFNTLLIYFPEFANKVANRPFTTMEQLWLSFVMHQKYGKVWNGEDWVKEL